MNESRLIPIMVDKKQVNQIKDLLEKLENVVNEYVIEGLIEPVVPYMAAKVLIDKLASEFVQSIGMVSSAEKEIIKESVPSFTTGQA